jgi:hypothetical protein
VELALVLLLVLAVGAFVRQPLRRPPETAPAARGAHLAALEAERDAKLAAIRDLEADLAAGKLTHDDHRRLDGELRAEAARALRRLDEARAA